MLNIPMANMSLAAPSRFLVKLVVPKLMMSFQLWKLLPKPPGFTAPNLAPAASLAWPIMVLATCANALALFMLLIKFVRLPPGPLPNMLLPTFWIIPTVPPFAAHCATRLGMLNPGAVAMGCIRLLSPCVTPVTKACDRILLIAGLMLPIMLLNPLLAPRLPMAFIAALPIALNAPPMAPPAMFINMPVRLMGLPLSTLDTTDPKLLAMACVTPFTTPLTTLEPRLPAAKPMAPLILVATPLSNPAAAILAIAPMAAPIQPALELPFLVGGVATLVPPPCNALIPACIPPEAAVPPSAANPL